MTRDMKEVIFSDPDTPRNDRRSNKKEALLIYQVNNTVGTFIID